MPYLHYESHARFKKLSAALMDETPANTEVDKDQCLIRRYLHQEYPLHPRRTLDQFYYGPLDTKRRDSDQVVYRYMKNVLEHEDPQLLMVDQLWIWILDGGRTLVSCFPSQSSITDKDRENPLHDVHKSDVLSSILQKLGSPYRPEIRSPYELAVVICMQCYGTFFDPSRGLDEHLHFVQFFERSIGNVSNQETVLFHEVKEFLEDIKLEHDRKDGIPMDFRKELEEKEGCFRKSSLDTLYTIWNDQKARDSDSIEKTRDEYLIKRSTRLLDISTEVRLMHEIKDILDELRIIRLVFDDQFYAVENMLDLMDHGDIAQFEGPIEHAPPMSRIPSGGHYPPTLPGLAAAASSTSTTTYNFKNFLKILKRQREVIQRMTLHANRVYMDIEHLLDLKQKQASVFEAHYSERQAGRQRQLLEQAKIQNDKAGSQGKTIMVFTVVTVFFLPASFMTAYFAIPISQYSHTPNGNIDLPLGYVSGWVVGMTAICVSIVSLIGFGINSLHSITPSQPRKLWRGYRFRRGLKSAEKEANSSEEPEVSRSGTHYGYNGSSRAAEEGSLK
jgi:hypothetical protein